jgi:hypothetical protein
MIVGDWNTAHPGAAFFAAIAGSTGMQRVRRLTLPACIAGHTLVVHRVMLDEATERIFWKCTGTCLCSQLAGFSLRYPSVLQLPDAVPAWLQTLRCTGAMAHATQLS